MRLETAANNYNENWQSKPRLVQLAHIHKKRLILDERAWLKCLAGDDDQNSTLRNLPVCVVCISGQSRTDNAIVFRFLLQCMLNTDQQKPLTTPAPEELLLSSQSEIPLWLFDDIPDDLTAPGDDSLVQLVAWSRPIVRTYIDSATNRKRQCAVLLTTSNAEWDNKQWSSGKAKMFAFCAHLSSVLLVDVNQGKGLSQRVTQLLEFLTDYERRVKHALGSSSKHRILQQLVVLVSNLPNEKQWQDNLSLGTHHGRELQQVCAGVTHKQLEPVAEMFSADHFRCCLLPANGVETVSEALSDTDLALLPKNYVNVMKTLTESIVSAIVPKKCCGYEVTCEDLLQFSTKFAAILEEDGAAPDVPGLVTTTVDNCFGKICDDKLNKQHELLFPSAPDGVFDNNVDQNLEALLVEFDMETSGGDSLKLHEQRAELEENLSRNWTSFKETYEKLRVETNGFDEHDAPKVLNKDEVQNERIVTTGSLLLLLVGVVLVLLCITGMIFYKSKEGYSTLTVAAACFLTAIPAVGTFVFRGVGKTQR